MGGAGAGARVYLTHMKGSSSGIARAVITGMRGIDGAFNVAAGLPQTVDPFQVVQLNATVPTSGEVPASWVWRQLSGVPVQLYGTAPALSFFAPAERDGAVLVFEVTADPGDGRAVATDTVTITARSHAGFYMFSTVKGGLVAHELRRTAKPNLGSPYTPPEEPPPPPPPVSAPTMFGTLDVALSSITAEAAAGQRDVMIELNWANWQPTQTGGVGVRTSGTLPQDTINKVSAAINAGMRVTLGWGLHNAPSWVATTYGAAVKFVNETTPTPASSTSLDLIWSKQSETLVNAYFADVKAVLSTVTIAGKTLWQHIWAARIAFDTAAGELFYPTGEGTNTYHWWGFSTFAQTGGANLATGAVPANAAVSAGGAGFAGAPSGSTQVTAWFDWYVGSLARATVRQEQALIDLGFLGWFEPVCPGLGVRPATVTAIRALTALPSNSSSATGAAWNLIFRDLTYKFRTAIQCSSMADGAGSNSVPVPTDATTPPDSTSITTGWSSYRIIANAAYKNNIPHVRGENTGRTVGNAAFYEDTTSAGMLQVAFDMIAASKVVYGNTFHDKFEWAHDFRLWNGQVPYSAYSSRFQPIIGSNPALPDYPVLP